MGTYFRILDKEAFDCKYVKECELKQKSRGLDCKQHRPLNEKYGFVLRSGSNIFETIDEEIPEIPYKWIGEFFHYIIDEEDESEDKYAKYMGPNAQEKFKELRKIAQEHLDYINEHKIELEDPDDKEILENILKIPVEEVYYLEAG